MEIRRTVKEVFDCKTGLNFESNSFFISKSEEVLLNLRYELQEVFSGRKVPIYKCTYCLENLALLGGKGKNPKILHFAHKRSEGTCCQKSDEISLSIGEINGIKYNGQKEGQSHIFLKNFIANSLEFNKENNLGVSEVIIDKNWRGKNPNISEWKRPDVRCKYNNINLVFEIQLSTTYLSVIEERQHFYKENNTFILWVFKNFEDDDKYRRFTDNDVIFSNNQNAFILDDEAVLKSEKEGMLFFKCFYRNPIIENFTITKNWEMGWITLEDLVFDFENYKVFGFDVEKLTAVKINQLNLVRVEQKKQREAEAIVVNIQKQLRIDLKEVIVKKTKLKTKKEEIDLEISKIDLDFNAIKSLKFIENNNNELSVSIIKYLSTGKSLKFSFLSHERYNELVSYLEIEFKIKEISQNILQIDSQILQHEKSVSDILNLESFGNNLNLNKTKILSPNIEKHYNFIKGCTFDKISYFAQTEQYSLLIEERHITSEFEFKNLLQNKKVLFIFDFSEYIIDKNSNKGELDILLLNLKTSYDLIQEKLKAYVNKWLFEKETEFLKKIEVKIILLKNLEKSIKILQLQIQQIEKDLIPIYEKYGYDDDF